MHTSSWAEKIYTADGLTRKDVLGGIKALDIGCGNKKLPGAIGMDILGNIHAEIHHNLDVFPWPIESDSFDLILMSHILEHADDIHTTLNEVYRVLKPGGTLVIQVPYFRHVDAFTSPDHRHFFTAHTLDYLFDVGGRHIQYISAFFEKTGFWYDWPGKKKTLAGIVKKLLQRQPWWYDQYFSLLLPARCLTWEMKKPA